MVREMPAVVVAEVGHGLPDLEAGEGEGLARLHSASPCLHPAWRAALISLLSRLLPDLETSAAVPPRTRRRLAVARVWLGAHLIRVRVRVRVRVKAKVRIRVRVRVGVRVARVRRAAAPVAAARTRRRPSHVAHAARSARRAPVYMCVRVLSASSTCVVRMHACMAHGTRMA